MNMTVAADWMYSQIKKTKQKAHTPAHISSSTCVLPKWSGKQKVSTTKHWGTEFVDMSKSIEATSLLWISSE